MSSTMTTTARHSSALTLAPTQNTAPVHEYRCMFSHDLRKKQKKWHDGCLRFHTFNKRVMVYDESKNFVGDLHYRDEGYFGEGTELQLDRGVLVQVEDRIGQTETDLAPLLEKRRPEDDNNNRRPLPRLSASIQASRAKPKTLAALLGPSQGPLGRARLPNRSPFAQRQVDFNLARSDEPSPKRRRLFAGKENFPQISIPKSSTTVAGNHASYGSRMETSRKPKPNNSILVSAEDESTTRMSLNRPLNGGRNQNGTSNNPVAVDSDTSRSHSERNQTRIYSPRHSGELASVSGDLYPYCHAQVSGPRQRMKLRGKAPLLFSKDKPRKKLMYKALLLKPAQDRDPGYVVYGSNDSNHDRSDGDDAPWNSGLNSERHPGSGFDISNDRLVDIAGVAGTDIEESNVSPVRPVPDVNSITSSDNLFLSQVPNDHAVEATFDPRIDSERNSTLESPLSQRAPTPRNREEDIVKSLQFSENMAAPFSLTQLDQELLMPPPAPAPAPPPVNLLEQYIQPPQRRSRQRVLSASNSCVQSESCLQPTSMIPSVLDSLRRRQKVGNDVVETLRSPRKLHRSISDTLPLKSDGVVESAAKPATVSDDEPLGPWTKMEAFLLFDWWPPNMEKPPYHDKSTTGHSQVGTRLVLDEVYG